MATTHGHITGDEIRISIEGNATIRLTIYRNGQPLWTSQSDIMTPGDTFTLRPITLTMPYTITDA